MKIIILFVLGFLLFVCVPLRIFVFNIFKAIPNMVKDLFLYFKHKKWNEAPYGKINMYTGLFGKGKTLSAVRYVTDFYNRYNNKKIYDDSEKKYITQYVQVLSNVDLRIPFVKLVSMNQVIEVCKTVREFNKENDCRMVTIVLGDEFSVNMNSRNFRTNIDGMLLNALLTCRHSYVSLIMTSQRFTFCDVLIRMVTTNVIDCKKIWRLQVQNIYDAWDLEQAGTTLKLKPVRRGGFFVTNRDYENYDTRAVVDNLIKDYEAGEMLSQDLILQLQGRAEPDDSNAHLSRKYRKSVRKRSK